MKATILLTAVMLLVCNCSTLWGDDSGLYHEWSSIMSRFVDPNTGLTIFPTLSIPLGGTYESMGTAHTAIAQDSGFIEANPSASALLANTELSFAHHNWIADSNLEGVVYTMRFDDLGIGLGGKFLYVPFTAYDAWGEKGPKGYISETIATVNLSYNFLSTYYFHGVAAGGNLKVAYRNIPPEFAPGQSAIAFMADLGAQTSFNFLKFYFSRSKNFSVGVVLKNLGLSMLGGEQLPLAASAGVAYSPVRPVKVSFDLNYPFSLDPVNAPAEKMSAAAGTSISVTEFLSVQAGVLLKMANPRISIGATVDLGTMSIVVNYNLDLSGQSNPLDKLSVQARFNLGDLGRAVRQEEVEQIYLLGIEEYANGNLEQAIAHWKKVIALDPKYLPARDNLRMAEEAVALQREMESGRKE